MWDATGYVYVYVYAYVPVWIVHIATFLPLSTFKMCSCNILQIPTL